MTLLMADQGSALTRDNVREEAREIISAIDASRAHPVRFEAHWRRLWQLVREAKAAYLPWESSNPGPWHLTDTAESDSGASPNLTAGDFMVAMWPPDHARLGGDLPGLLNWAGVPAPDAA